MFTSDESSASSSLAQEADSDSTKKTVSDSTKEYTSDSAKEATSDSTDGSPDPTEERLASTEDVTATQDELASTDRGLVSTRPAGTVRYDEATPDRTVMATEVTAESEDITTASIIVTVATDTVFNDAASVPLEERPTGPTRRTDSISDATEMSTDERADTTAASESSRKTTTENEARSKPLEERPTGPTRRTDGVSDGTVMATAVTAESKDITTASIVRVETDTALVDAKSAPLEDRPTGPTRRTDSVSDPTAVSTNARREASVRPVSNKKTVASTTGGVTGSIKKNTAQHSSTTVNRDTKDDNTKSEVIPTRDTTEIMRSVSFADTNSTQRETVEQREVTEQLTRATERLTEVETVRPTEDDTEASTIETDRPTESQTEISQEPSETAFEETSDRKSATRRLTTVRTTAPTPTITCTWCDGKPETGATTEGETPTPTPTPTVSVTTPSVVKESQQPSERPDEGETIAKSERPSEVKTERPSEDDTEASTIETDSPFIDTTEASTVESETPRMGYTEALTKQTVQTERPTETQTEGSQRASERASEGDTERPSEEDTEASTIGTERPSEDDIKASNIRTDRPSGDNRSRGASSMEPTDNVSEGTDGTTYSQRVRETSSGKTDAEGWFCGCPCINNLIFA